MKPNKGPHQSALPSADKQDKRLFALTLALGGALFFSSINPFTMAMVATPTIVGSAIPVSLAILIFLAVPAMYWGIRSQDKSVLETKCTRKKLIKTANQLMEIKCKVYYRPTESGTYWEIYNIGVLPWERAALLIERNVAGEKACEKHLLENVTGKSPIFIESKLAYSSPVQWKVLVVTTHNSKQIFPEIWRKQQI